MTLSKEVEAALDDMTFTLSGLTDDPTDARGRMLRALATLRAELEDAPNPEEVLLLRLLFDAIKRDPHIKTMEVHQLVDAVTAWQEDNK